MIDCPAFSKAELRLKIPLGCRQSLWGEGDSDAASGKISIISKCFHRIKQEKYLLLETLKMQKNLKTIGAYPTESTDLIFKAFENILYFTLKEFHLVSLVLEIIIFLNLGRLHNSAQLQLAFCLPNLLSFDFSKNSRIFSYPHTLFIHLFFFL